jgi:hypothetical protein
MKRVAVGSILNMDLSTYKFKLLMHTKHRRRIGDTMKGSLTTLLLKNIEQYSQACNESKWENKRESRLSSVQNKQAVMQLILEHHNIFLAKVNSVLILATCPSEQQDLSGLPLR